MRKLLLSSFVLFSAMLNAQTSFKSGLLTYTVTGAFTPTTTSEISDAL